MGLSLSIGVRLGIDCASSLHLSVFLELALLLKRYSERTEGLPKCLYNQQACFVRSDHSERHQTTLFSGHDS